ncbi:uncharacterized protein RSE6_10437 [Rhynchosporium secalis]|uniref:Secreted protein n=1 Tax=Rhynchosporium secalis TaxID=38038 RepID=A0A1E1MKF1_RHYSE|nr:uncharacterized protein RSE6_10437 [Rhynchosporium secalis]
MRQRATGHLIFFVCAILAVFFPQGQAMDHCLALLTPVLPSLLVAARFGGLLQEDVTHSHEWPPKVKPKTPSFTCQTRTMMAPQCSIYATGSERLDIASPRSKQK